MNTFFCLCKEVRIVCWNAKKEITEHRTNQKTYSCFYEVVLLFVITYIPVTIQHRYLVAVKPLAVSSHLQYLY